MGKIKVTLVGKKKILQQKIKELIVKVKDDSEKIYTENSLMQEGRINGPIEVRENIIKKIINMQLSFENFLKENEINVEVLNGRLYLVDKNKKIELDDEIVRKMELLGIYLDPNKKEIAMNAIEEILTNLTETMPIFHTTENLERRIGCQIIFNTVSDVYKGKNSNFLGVSLINKDQSKEIETCLPTYFISRIISNSQDAFQEEKALVEEILSTFKRLKPGESLGNIKEKFMPKSIEFQMDENLSAMAAVQKEKEKVKRYIILDTNIYKKFIDLIERDIDDSAQRSEIALCGTGLDNLDSELLGKMATYDDDILEKNLVHMEKVPFLQATYRFLSDLYQKGYYIEVQKIYDNAEGEKNWTINLILPYGKSVDYVEINKKLNSYFINPQVADYEEIKLGLGFQDAGRLNEVSKSYSEYLEYLAKKYPIRTPRLRKVISHEINEFMEVLVDGDFSKINPLAEKMEAKINDLPLKDKMIVIEEIKELFYSMQQVLPKEQFNQILRIAKMDSFKTDVSLVQKVKDVFEVSTKNVAVAIKERRIPKIKLKRITGPKVVRSIWKINELPTKAQPVQKIAHEFEEKTSKVLE